MSAGTWTECSLRSQALLVSQDVRTATSSHGALASNETKMSCRERERVWQQAKGF